MHVTVFKSLLFYSNQVQAAKRLLHLHFDKHHDLRKFSTDNSIENFFVEVFGSYEHDKYAQTFLKPI